MNTIWIFITVIAIIFVYIMGVIFIARKFVKEVCDIVDKAFRGELNNKSKE